MTSGTGSRGQGASLTVLVVEDDPVAREMIEYMLHREGHTVLTAPDPAAALTLAEGHAGPLHLLVTDMSMPGMSGRELAEQLLARRPGLKILYISGYVADEAVGTRLGWQGAAFLQKPFSAEALHAQIRALLT